jgi:uncharacterized membrane protein YhaH (DUF805 family)
MRAYNYRMNRATYGVLLAGLVVAYVVLVNTMKHPPGAELVVAIIAVPRLHDVGRSGWWLLILFVGELVAVGIGWPGGAEGILIAGGFYVLLCLALLVVLGFIPGQRTANSWGEPPVRGFHFNGRGPATPK